ncbi:metallophosphoesterase [Maridesulfovibrio sp.]|uniref:metallophosphoesterase n=1 Tax=Maridesulfovibrio sp. TaxID=2795000 RepID=UPI0039EEA53F
MLLIRGRIKQPKLHLCVVLLIMLLPFLLGNGNGCGTASSGTFIAISDVHFNPFTDTALFGRLVAAPADSWAAIFRSSAKTELPDYGSETNFALLSKALDSAAAQDSYPAIVIFPGDILCHHFNETFESLYGSADQKELDSFILKTVRFFVLQVRERFPEAPVFFTLGNNDSYAGDYNLIAGGSFLSDTATLFQDQWFGSQVHSPNFNRTYTAGGYYAASAKDDSILLISLNSVLFSANRPAPVAGDAAYTQLDWFENQLAAAENSGQLVYIVTHVPPGANIFSSITKYMDTKGKISAVKGMWHDEYQNRFLSIMDKYSNLNVTFFSGHTHMDEFRLLYNDTRSNSPARILGQPSISPVFKNNPAYKVFNINRRNWELQDYTALTILLDQKNENFEIEYKFSTLYGLSNATAANMEKLSESLATDGAAKTAYIKYYYSVSPHSAITDINWPAYRCSTGAVRADKYKNCVNNSAP